jgi:hypothetical protein
VGDLHGDLGNTNPIYGVRDTERVSFAAAVAATGIPGLEGAVFAAQHFATQFLVQCPDDPLDNDEIASHNFYTMETPFYPEFNRALASKDRQQAKKFFKFLRLALGGIHKLPLLRGMFARGIRNPNLANYYDGRAAFFWWAFTSTTKKIDVTKQFLGNGPRMLFMIDGVGVDISRYSSIPEAEVLMLPGSMLQVTGVLTEGDQLTITTLKQLPSPPLVDFQHPGLTAALSGGGGGGGAPPAPAPAQPPAFEFGGLLQELGLVEADAPEIMPALQQHGLITANDIMGFLADECGGVTADGLRQMGIAKYGTRSRMLQGLLPKSPAPQAPAAPVSAPAAQAPAPAPAPAPVIAPAPVLTPAATSASQGWGKSGTGITLSAGGLVATMTHSDGSYHLVTGNEPMMEGRHYWEVKIEKDPAGCWCNFLVGAVRPGLDHDKHHYNTTDAYYIDTKNGGLYGNGDHGNGCCRSGQFAVGDRVGVLLDLDAGWLRFYLNGKRCGLTSSIPHQGVTGPLVRAAAMCEYGQVLTALPGAAAPAGVQ